VEHPLPAARATRLLRVFVHVEDVVLGYRLDAHVVQQPEQLCAMVCAVIDDNGVPLRTNAVPMHKGGIWTVPARARPGAALTPAG